MVLKTQAITALTDLFATQQVAEHIVSTIDLEKINFMSIVPVADGETEDGSIIFSFLQKLDKTIHPAEVFVRICLNEKKSVFNFDPVRHEILIASSYSEGLGKDFMEKVLKKVKKQAIKGIPHFQKILTKCRKLKTLSDEEMETEYQADLKAFEEKNGYKYGA